jgi:dephospho-CoA kinase
VEAQLNTSKPPRALALVGMPGAGKTLCAKHLEEQGYFQFRFGGIVVNEVVQRGWAINPENERVVREELRANEGMAVMAQRALPHLKAALETHAHIIIDGLYSFSEYKMLHTEFGGEMVVVAIISPRALRYERLTSRLDRPLTPEEAELRDYSEIETLEKGGPIAIADYFLLNDRQPGDLLAELDALVKKLGFTPG